MNAAESLAERITDIVQAVETGSLLRPRSHLVDEGWHVIGDFALAQDYAYHRYLTDAEDADNWIDLRKYEASELLGPTYSDPQGVELRAAVRGLAERFIASSLDRLPKAYRSVVEEVAADLQNIALSRMVPNAGTGLFPLLWEVYQRGGWPCGWEGAYPEGRLVVFRPRAT